jgi:predicted TIM-barrel fold metal-dependent hydrolase
VRNTPAFGKINFVEEMVKTFSGIRFIVGHNGLFQSADVMKRLNGCRNVWVNKSFQSPSRIRKLVRTFGEDKVLYASDWPFANRPSAIKTVRVACRGDRRLEELILCGNFRELLGL